MKNNFEIISRAVIIHRGKILLCRMKTKSWYFLPGGHVEFGEKSENALKREMLEELGAKIKKIKFIGVVENSFGQISKMQHEINIVFQVTLDNFKIASLEDHLEFNWVDIASLKKNKLRPIAMHKAIMRWCKDKKEFFGSAI